MNVITNKCVYVVKTKAESVPELAIKVSVDYPCREKLEFNVGYSNNADQTNPIYYTNYSSFNKQGGWLPMQGINNDPIEVGLDYGYWYLNEDVGKIFFIIYEDEDANLTDGTIEYFSIVDYRWEEVFELYSDETNVSIVNDDKTVLSIDYDLIPHESDITENLSLFSNMVSRFTPTVDRDAILTVEDGVCIDMYDSEIHINSGSLLILEDNVTLLAKKGNCKLIIDGDVSIGSNVNFIAEDDAEMEVFLNNDLLQSTFNNTTFEKSKLNSHAISLTIDNSNFNNSNINSYQGNISISNTVFNNTTIFLKNQLEDFSFSANITNCNFNYNCNNDETAINIWNYSNFEINSNTIHNYNNGLIISQSGDGEMGNQNIVGNIISNNISTGISVYNSTASICRNHIYQNNYGLKFYDNSNIALYGNESGGSYTDRQVIKDNTSFEVYSSKYSFPFYFRYNSIIDEDNNIGNPDDDPMIYFDCGISPNPFQNDVRYNYWGINFDAEEDFHPSTSFNYTPTWIPPDWRTDDSADKLLYEDAENQFKSEEYSNAETLYKQLVNQYSDSKYAKASMIQLFALEKYAGNNYNSLKQYYTTNDTILSDTSLTKLGDFLANKCDIALENWQSAIDWYENEILNPETFNDSLFAIIDLGYTYLLMENDSSNNSKSSYTGKMQEYIPKSMTKFVEKRDYLLSLLPVNKAYNSYTSLENNPVISKSGELLQNIPNPFSEKTIISYTLSCSGSVCIKVFNNNGKEVKSIKENIKNTGQHKTEFNAKDLSAGIYFYSLFINEKLSDTKKMIIVK